MTEAPLVLRVSDGVTFSPLDVSLGGTYHVAHLPQQQRFFKIPDALLSLLRLFDGRRDLDAVAREYSAAISRPCSVADVREICDTLLIPRGLVVPVDAAEPPPLEPRQPARYIHWYVHLLRAPLVGAIGRTLSRLYHPAVAVPLVMIWLMASTWFAVRQAMDGLQLGGATGATFLGAFLLMQASCVLHELGHASAASRFGLQPGPIGFGFYLYFPVFFSDVTAAWLLPRKQRIVVNLGGLYFQSIFMMLLLAIFAVAPAPVWRTTILAHSVLFAATLNPLLRWDGYWVFADLVGVPNLRAEINRLIQYALRRLLRRPATMPEFYLRLPRASKVFVFLYFVVSSLLLGAFYVVLFVILPRIVWGLPHDVAVFAAILQRGSFSLAMAGDAAHQALLLTLRIALVVYLAKIVAGMLRRFVPVTVAWIITPRSRRS